MYFKRQQARYREHVNKYFERRRKHWRKLTRVAISLCIIGAVLTAISLIQPLFHWLFPYNQAGQQSVIAEYFMTVTRITRMVGGGSLIALALFRDQFYEEMIKTRHEFIELEPHCSFSFPPFIKCFKDAFPEFVVMAYKQQLEKERAKFKRDQSAQKRTSRKIDDLERKLNEVSQKLKEHYNKAFPRKVKRLFLTAQNQEHSLIVRRNALDQLEKLCIVISPKGPHTLMQKKKISPKAELESLLKEVERLLQNTSNHRQQVYIERCLQEFRSIQQKEPKRITKQIYCLRKALNPNP